MIVPPATAAVPQVQVPVEMHPRGEGGHRPRPGGRRGKPCGANAGQDCHGGGRRFGGGQRTMASDFKVADRQPCGEWVLRPFVDMHPREKGLVPTIRFNAKVAVVSKMRIVSNTKNVSNTTFHFHHIYISKRIAKYLIHPHLSSALFQDEVLNTPQPHFKNIKQCYPHYFHKLAKNNVSFVYYSQPGLLKMQELNSLVKTIHIIHMF